MDVALVAVQAALDPERYRSEERYRAWIVELADRAVSGLPGATEVPRVVAFPELIGAPLAWLLDRPPDPRDVDQARHRVAETVRGHPGAIVRAAARSRRIGPSLLLHTEAVRAGRIHVEAFAEAARAVQATVVAGTILGPPVGFEASRGWHVSDPRPRARAATFGPDGSWIGATDKVFLTPGVESRIGLSRGRIEDLRPLVTPAGPVGVAICLDAFHDEVIARLDGLGTRILVQPSANLADWSRPWPGDPSLREGEAWWRYGAPRAVRGRLSLRYGVNPMLVGAALGLRPRGRSSIVGPGPGGGTGLPGGVLAAAERDDAERFVRAVVPWAGPSR